MSSYNAIINIVTAGSSKIEKIISKVSQLESIVDSINKKPIDINAASAQRQVDSFHIKTKILDANIQSIQKSSDSASKAFETYSARLNAANKILDSSNPNTKKYAQALESQKKAQDGITQSINDMTKAEKDLITAQEKRERASIGLKEAEKAKEAAAAVRQLADDYLLLGAYQQRSIKSGQILKDQSSVTVSQLKAQANALALVANNSKIASSEFNRFSIAGQIATGKIYEAQQKNLQALAFGLSPQAPRVNVGRQGESSISAARSQVSELVNSYSTIVKSEAAMAAFVARATELQTIVPIISNEWKVLGSIIDKVKIDMSATKLSGQSSMITFAKGPYTDLGSISAFTKRESYQRKVNDELSRQVAVEDRINQGLLNQVQKTQLLNQLYRAADALAQNRLDDAVRITREIDKQRFSLERLNRSTGPYRTGLVSPMDGAKRLGAIYGANQMLSSKLLELEAKGINVSNEKLTLLNQVNRIQSATFDINTRNLSIENETLAAVSKSITLLQRKNNILKYQQTGYPSSPIRGGVNMPGSPIFKETPFLERRFGRRGGAAISEGLIGGAFPLLFGQGLASSIGGGLGGALGGFAGGGLGFGLSLIGTALGAAIDGFVTAAKDAAASLRDPITNFQKLADSGLALSNASIKADQAQQLQIKNLIEYGNSAKAASIIQEELAKKIGVLAMKDMANLDEQSVRLGKAWAELNFQIQAAIAGPLARLLEWTANMIELATGANRGNAKNKDDILRRIISGGEKATSLISGREFLSRILGTAADQKQRGGNALASPVGTKIDPGLLQQEQDKNRQENRDKEDKLLQRQRETADLIKNSENQIRQFRYQTIDLERSAIDYRRRINDDIFNKQQDIAQKQIANDQLRSQIAINAIDLQYRKTIANEDGRVAAVLSAEADLVRLRKTNAAELEAARKQLELKIAKQQRDTQNYIYGLAREADSIRRSTLNLELQVIDYKIQQERKIQDIRKQTIRDEQDAQIKADRGSPVWQGYVQGKGSAYNGGNTVSGFPITSRPGMRWGRMHAGVDVAMPIDTPLGYSVGGFVKSTLTLGGYGKTLEVQLDNGVTVFAAHLNEVLVKAGDKFTANQILARTGKTGRSTGPHAHFEGVRGGDPYAPLPYVVLGKGVGAAAATNAAKPKPTPKPTAKPTPQQLNKQFPNDGWPGWGSTRDFPVPNPRPSMLMPGASKQIDPMSDGVSSNIGNQFLSLIGGQNRYENLAMSRGDARIILDKFTQEAIKGNVSPEAFSSGVQEIANFAQSPDRSRRTIRNVMATPGARLLINTPGLASMAIRRMVNQNRKNIKDEGVNPAAIGKHIEPLIDLFKKMKGDNLLRSNVSIREVETKLQQPLYGALMDWVKANLDNPKIQGILGKTGVGSNKQWGPKGLLPIVSGFEPENFGVSLTPQAKKEALLFQQQEAKRKAYEASPEGKRALAIQAEKVKKFKEFQKKLNKMLDRSALPSNFDTSKLQQIIGSTASTDLTGLLASQPAQQNAGLPAEVNRATTKVEKDTNAIPRPAIPALPVSAVRSQVEALNAKDNEVSKKAVLLQEKLQKSNEAMALQRVYEVTQGENILKQKNRELDLIKAEASSIGAMSADKQAIATFDAKSKVIIQQIKDDNEDIMKNTTLQGKEKEDLAKYAQLYLERQTAALAVDKQMLQVSQQMRFNSETAAMRLELQTRGAGLNAGFFGAAAQAYNQEIMSGSGDPAKAAEKAKLTRIGEVNNEIVSMRENIAMLKDPTYQVMEGARAIGSAFSDSFKGVVSGSMTAQQSLAAFFQKTSDHFLEMASQMLTQQLILKLIGFGMNLFAPGAGAIGGAVANFQMPSQAFMPTGGYGFAKGGMFTNSIVASPTLFKFANGGALRTGLMGEAGPEAVMPLTRGPGGRLGVDASGSGGAVMVNVSVDAKGTSVEGDSQKSAELGKVIAAAVQQELIKQKRSGGILSK